MLNNIWKENDDLQFDCDPIQWESMVRMCESKYVWVYECICAHRATECTKANEVSIIYSTWKLTERNRHDVSPMLLQRSLCRCQQYPQ